MNMILAEPSYAEHQEPIRSEIKSGTICSIEMNQYYEWVIVLQNKNTTEKVVLTEFPFELSNIYKMIGDTVSIYLDTVEVFVPEEGNEVRTVTRGIKLLQDSRDTDKTGQLGKAVLVGYIDDIRSYKEENVGEILFDEGSRISKISIPYESKDKFLPFKGKNVILELIATQTYFEEYGSMRKEFIVKSCKLQEF